MRPLHVSAILVLVACPSARPVDPPGNGNPDAGAIDSSADLATAYGVTGRAIAEVASTIVNGQTLLIETFTRDTAAAPICNKDVDGCRVSVLQTCSPACGGGQTCLADTCTAKCVMPSSLMPRCAPACASDEECAFDAGGAAKCRKIVYFGPIAISGPSLSLTLQAITQVGNSQLGAPPASGSTFSVTGLGKPVAATGATGPSGSSGNAGPAYVGAFSQSLRVPQTIASNVTTLRTQLYGSGDVTIDFAPAAGHVIVTGGIIGGGDFSCEAAGDSGTFVLKRSVLDAAKFSASSTIQLLVSRENFVLTKGVGVVGGDGSAPTDVWVASSFQSLDNQLFAPSGPGGGTGPSGVPGVSGVNATCSAFASNSCSCTSGASNSVACPPPFTFSEQCCASPAWPNSGGCECHALAAYTCFDNGTMCWCSGSVPVSKGATQVAQCTTGTCCQGTGYCYCSSTGGCQGGEASTASCTGGTGAQVCSVPDAPNGGSCTVAQ